MKKVGELSETGLLVQLGVFDLFFFLSFAHSFDFNLSSDDRILCEYWFLLMDTIYVMMVLEFMKLLFCSFYLGKFCMLLKIACFICFISK